VSSENIKNKNCAVSPRKVCFYLKITVLELKNAEYKIPSCVMWESK
jgi:hypothetical protein